MPAYSGDRKLAVLRRTARLTQKAVAERIGKSTSTYIKYESGEVKPSAAVLGRIADALGCSVAELYDHDDGSFGAWAERVAALLTPGSAASVLECMATSYDSIDARAARALRAQADSLAEGRAAA